jgi:hypothetical protein
MTIDKEITMLYWKIVSPTGFSVGITRYPAQPALRDGDIPINITRELFYELLGELDKKAGIKDHQIFPTKQCKNLYLFGRSKC